MPKMIALKKFRYPSGPEAREYELGDEIEVLTDRDAKALRLIKAAKDAPVEEKKAEPKSTPHYSTATMSAEDAPRTAPRRSTRRSSYNREDMTAEDND